MKKVLGLMLVLAMLVACAPAKVETTEAVHKADFKVGLIGPLSGDLATFGTPVKEAAELAIEEINAQDKLGGRKMTLVVEDDQCDSKRTVTIAQKFVDVDKVTAVAGPFCSGTVLASAPVFEANKVLVIAPGATNPAVKDAGDYIFRVVPPDTNQGAAGAQLLKKLGANKVGVLYLNNDYGVGLKDAFAAEATKLGMTLEYDTFNPNDADMRTQATKMNLIRPDMIYLIAHPKETQLMLLALDQAGLNVQVVGADGSKEDTTLKAGEAAEGFIATAPGVPKSPELESFAAAYKAKYGRTYEVYTPEMYDVVNILAKACAATDCTSTAMKDHLYSMGEYKGASGTYKFDANGEVDKGYDYWQVQNGTWVAYTPE